MAKAQYRVSGTLDWQAQSGMAILAIYNPVGSGKKLTINSFECENLTAKNAVVSVLTIPASGLMLARGTCDTNGATPITGVPLDSNSSAWPSTVKVSKMGTMTNPSPLRHVMPQKMMVSGASVNDMARFNTIGARKTVRPSIFRAARGQSPVEPVVVRQGESVALIPRDTSLSITVPYLVDVTLLRGTSTWQFRTFTHALATGQALFCVDNAAGSGEVIEIIDVSVSEVGTFDSPYFQVVPMGPLNATSAQDVSRQVDVFKMDSTYPTAPFTIYQNVNIDPAGMPTRALSDGSAGSPKGFNYLQTKDFLGPVYRTYFPEYEGTNAHSTPSATAVMDNMGFAGHRHADLFFRRAGITLREGEGIALVSGAETATIASAVGVSGWSSWAFGAQITSESRFAPTLSFTGLKPGTEVRVYRTSDGVELAGVESSGTSFSYNYDWDGVDLQVDIVLHHVNYLPIRFSGQYLGSGGLSVPVQQTFDRTYSNP